MMKTRYYYALTDSFTGDDPHDYTSGFANTKEPLAFVSRAARDNWLAKTRLLTACPLTRKQANKIAYTIYGGHKGCRIYGTGDHAVLVPSRW